MAYLLKNGRVSLELGDDGVYSVRARSISIAGCRAEAESDGVSVPFPWRTASAGPEAVVLTACNAVGKWRLEFRADPATPDRITVRMTGKMVRTPEKMTFAALSRGEAELTHFLGVGPRMGGCESILFPAAPEKNFRTASISMLSRGEDHLMIAAPLRGTFTAEFSGRAEDRLRDLRISGEFLHMAADTVDTGEIEFRSDADPFAMMTGWADRNRTVEKEVGDMLDCGWNSWDYYRWTITEDEVLANADLIAHDPVLSKRVKRIIVDDGWQYCYGEWEANCLFPHGMKYLADELRKMGFLPGLWFAPTIIEPHCRIAQLHPEMLAMSDGGQPALAYTCMKRYGMVLDPTVPAVQTHLRDLFARYVEMGYGYFKLDFMAATLNARRFHDATVPRSEIPRLIVKPVYEGVNGRARILGCNYLYCGGNEFVDAVRCGADIHVRWDRITANVVSAAANFFANRRLWLTDPDFALARSAETSDDPDRQKLNPLWVYVEPDSPFNTEIQEFNLSSATADEAEVLLSIVIVSGGAMNFSDNLRLLNARGLDMLRRAAAADRSGVGVPLDLFRTERPAVFLQRCDTVDRVLLVNYGDAPCEMSFDLAAHGIAAEKARDFWRDRELTVRDGVLAETVPPHACCFAEIAR